jgi:hypothetical protein
MENDVNNKKGGNIMFAAGAGQGSSADGHPCPSPKNGGSFYFTMADKTVFMEIRANGEVYVRGNLVDTDRKVYENFREWLSHATFTYKQGTAVAEPTEEKRLDRLPDHES